MDDKLERIIVGTHGEHSAIFNLTKTVAEIKAVFLSALGEELQGLPITDIVRNERELAVERASLAGYKNGWNALRKNLLEKIQGGIEDK